MCFLLFKEPATTEISTDCHTLSLHYALPISPLGGVVAPGNHDQWFAPDALRRELDRQGLRVLQNEAVRLGPLIVGGVDDDYSRHDDVPATLAAMDRLGPGVPLPLTPSPDIDRKSGG